MLTSTAFSRKLYDECATILKGRLGLRKDDQKLILFRNVVMNPFPTPRNFIGRLTSKFRGIVEEEAKVNFDLLCNNSFIYTLTACRFISIAIQDPKNHEFILQGKDKLHLFHSPSFHLANRPQQLIVKLELDSRIKA